MKIDSDLQNAIDHWAPVGAVLSPINSEAEYDTMVGHMDSLIDFMGADENHPLTGLLHFMGDLVAEYDATRYDLGPAATGVEMLRHLIQEQGIRQSDLPEIGSQGVVSEVLRGLRELNVRQIRALAQRFGLPEQTFL